MLRVQSRTLATSDKKYQLVVSRNNKEIFDRHLKISVVFGIVWIVSCLLFCGISYFKNRTVDFSIIFLVYPVVMIIATLFFHSPKQRFEKLLRDIVDCLNLSSMLNLQVKIEYTRNFDESVVKIFSVISADKADLLVREIASYFQQQYKKPYIVDDYKVPSDRLIVYFSHVADERLTISSIEDLQALHGITPLTTKIQWDRKRQPMALVVGPTGSGKTSVIKTLILSFLQNDSKNTLYTIDGKESFLSVATSNFFDNNQTTTTPSIVIDMVTKLNDLMVERYEEMNADFQDEKDQTYDEKFQSGSVLLVIDELLALVIEMQALDKQSKPAERLYTQFNAKLLSLIVKGRSASIHVIVSGQMIPTSILPSEARDSLGFRLALGRISQSQATEIFGQSAKSLPSIDQEFSGLIWIDGLGWRSPKVFLSPYYEEEKLPFKKALLNLKKQR